MRGIFVILGMLVFITSLLLTACNNRSEQPRILVFSKTAGYRHSSIPKGVAAIRQLGKENNFAVDTTEDANWFTEDTLKKYAAVVFLSTTGDVLNHIQEAEFERYIQAGGGFAGIHAATDTEYDWGWYGRMVGGYFQSHPPGVHEAVLNVVDKSHGSTKHLPDDWKRTDEWYNFKKLNPDVNVLMKIDEKTYKGGENGENHPMSWYHEYDGGRAWYTALGHTDESYSEPDFLKHILGGIKYAIGKNKALNYKKAVTYKVPEEERFTKTPLVQGEFFEPTEMTILPNFDILIGQRRGEVLLYKNGTTGVKQALFLNVYHKTNTPGVNAEEGLMGIQKDPDFARNKYVYIFYSPIDTSVNRLSRFTFENDTLTSEKVILQFYSQREICCHTGGSIAFGKDRLLYLSTGDNSTPFDEEGNPYANHGFGPLDDRPGKEQYDARRSSSNTNDLRGKILRIKINENGTYEIPDGNLFPKNEKKARPEIYVMGNRNPYRISVDQKNGYLYWGEVGPDANADSMETRGPRGYDELNQARQAGYFGWPLFVGNNYPYRRHNYATGENGEAFDPAKPINDSRNNTGLRELPPVSPAFIWYPYGDSPDFPQVGSGGRNAMAGPIYYTDMFPAETRLPDYFNGKLFFYDWIRGWIKLVSTRPNGDFDKMEPFMPNTKFINPIDMEVGPDGRIYVLEYGSGWFSKNPDAGLYRIDYNGGNMAPTVHEVAIDKASGKLPLKVTVTLTATDPERDQLSYIWHINNTREVTTKAPTLELDLTEAGDYIIYAEVADGKGGVTKSQQVYAYAGNEAPTVDIEIQGNSMFYFPGQPVKYAVKVADKDSPGTPIDQNSLVVVADYLEGTDKVALSQGHQILSEAAMGKNLMESLDCKACHKEAEKSIGPSYLAVAQRYQKDPNAVPYLVGKIIKGGGGVWGETAMAAHPNLSEQDARQIVAWIQSLAAAPVKVKSLPIAGSVSPTANKPLKDNGVLYLTATYTDKGGPGLKPLSTTKVVTLRNSSLSFKTIEKNEYQGFSPMEFNGRSLMIMPPSEGWFMMDSLDLRGVQQVAFALGWQEAPVPACTFEIHLDKPDGPKIGEANFAGVSKQTPGLNFQSFAAPIQPVTDGKLHKLYIIAKIKGGGSNAMALSGMQLLAAR
ncbi:MAG: ThuA domain-containing protein [Saprospiraceae bacterium]